MTSASAQVDNFVIVDGDTFTFSIEKKETAIINGVDYSIEKDQLRLILKLQMLMKLLKILHFYIPLVKINPSEMSFEPPKNEIEENDTSTNTYGYFATNNDTMYSEWEDKTKDFDGTSVDYIENESFSFSFVNETKIEGDDAGNSWYYQQNFDLHVFIDIKKNLVSNFTYSLITEKSYGSDKMTSQFYFSVIEAGGILNNLLGQLPMPNVFFFLFALIPITMLRRRR